jgi:hypothetical protein
VRMWIRETGLVRLLGLWALLCVMPAGADEPGGGAAQAAGESQPERGLLEHMVGFLDVGQALAEHRSGRPDLPSELRDPSARYFFDDFASPTLDRRNWGFSAGATPTRDVLDGGRAASAVRLGAVSGAVAEEPELRSVAMPLARAEGVELSYTVQHHGVEAGERLAVEYQSEAGEWRTIERVVADGRDSVAFSRHIHVLPEDALHGSLRIRFRPGVDDQDDAWFLGEVVVVRYEPPHTLAVRVRPARNVLVEVLSAESEERWDGTTPFTRPVPVGTEVHMVAPPVVAERVFSHWSVDGVPQVDRERVLTLEMREDVEAVAHYRVWATSRSEASVAIVSWPESGMRVELGPEPERLYTRVITDGEYGCLVGEWLALLAPRRTERYVFSGWAVNGQAVAGNGSLLEHRVTGDEMLLAEYVRLGDMNGDGELDKLDVDEFVLALTDPVCYGERYPDLDRVQRGDVNGDGEFDGLDVERFVELLLRD